MVRYLEAGNYHTVNEAAEVLGVGTTRVRALIYKGELEVIKFGTDYLVSEDAILDLRQRRIDRAVRQIAELESKVQS